MQLREYGYIRAAAASIPVSIADPMENARQIISTIQEADELLVEVLVFAELAVTGYSCGDLFTQQLLLDQSFIALEKIVQSTKDMKMLIVAGLPLAIDDQLFNVAAVIHSGELLAFVPKRHTHCNNYGFRHFRSSSELNKTHVDFNGKRIPICENIIFVDQESKIRIGVCLDGELSSPVSPALFDAHLILHPGADHEYVGRKEHRKHLLSMRSHMAKSAYVYASAGSDESTGDHIYSGHCLIIENGKILDENRFCEKGKFAISDIDIELIQLDRLKSNLSKETDVLTLETAFSRDHRSRSLLRQCDPYPFLPGEEEEDEYFNEVLRLQATAYMQRMKKTGIHRSHIGISGGLDSTWALIVICKAHEMLGTPKENINCITMPGYGTTDASLSIARRICTLFGLRLREIPIIESTSLHFRDIEHDPDDYSVVYENAQARERTQILMDLANKENGLVVGTGDLSEIALGWSTYNGDHMSMYGVNTSVPKTLLRAMVYWYAHQQVDDRKEALLSVLKLPVSPELLPPDEKGNVMQKTEDILGDYDLNDFYLYQVIRGFSPRKILLHASYAFADRYDDKILLHGLKNFYRRFISQQFKRNTAPDSAKVLPLCLSSRWEFQMPSDASSALFLKELDNIEGELK